MHVNKLINKLVHSLNATYKCLQFVRVTRMSVRTLIDLPILHQ